MFSKFDTAWYQKRYPDAKSAGLSPKAHYQQHGKWKGYLPCKPSKLSKVDIVVLVAHLLAADHGGYFNAYKMLLKHLISKGVNSFKHFVMNIYLARIYRDDTSYEEWISNNELSGDDLGLAKDKLSMLGEPPRLLVLVEGRNEIAERQLHSLNCQTYSNFATTVVGKHEATHVYCDSHSHQSLNYVDRFEQVNTDGFDYIVILTGNTILHSYALYWFVYAILSDPSAKLIYGDEDYLTASGERSNPHFKSDWNYDLFLTTAYLGDVICLETNFVKSRLRIADEGYARLIFDLIDDCDHRAIQHIPKILSHNCIQNTNAVCLTRLQSEFEPELKNHLSDKRCTISKIVDSNVFNIIYPIDEPQPLVSLIIPTRDGYELIKQCIDSIENKTTYRNFEIIIVDNGSTDPSALNYFSALEKKSNYKVIRDNSPFNYSRLNNRAVSEASGDVIGLINNDIQVVEPNWLSIMVGQVLREGTGAVGAKLLYPSGRIQHGGVILGPGGLASHANLHGDGNTSGYFGRSLATQELCAVTAACLVVKRSNYMLVDGLNEKDLTVAFNDVDFCLKLRKIGLRNIWAAEAVLFHHESATRGEDISPVKRERFEREVSYMKQTWADVLRNDPFYNPNLFLDVPCYSIANYSRVSKWNLSINA